MTTIRAHSINTRMERALLGIKKEKKEKGKKVAVSTDFTIRQYPDLSETLPNWSIPKKPRTTGRVAYNPSSELKDQIERAREEARSRAMRRRAEARRYGKKFGKGEKNSASEPGNFEALGEEKGLHKGSSSKPKIEIPLAGKEPKPGLEDLPGSFSEAMKIIKEQWAVIKWTPLCNRKHSRLSTPSLRDLCIHCVSKTIEKIHTLEGFPDVLRHKLSQSLCNSRKMDVRVFGLLFSGSPTEICVKDCSWLEAEQLEEILKKCNTDHLRVLQLDLCARSMTDSVLDVTLAQHGNEFPKLLTISLRGALLTDVGMKALSSVPSLVSINLGHCSFLTSTGIQTLADNLGSSLRKLYIDYCIDIDAMLILPALKKLNHLEVLSVDGIQTVSDNFVSELMSICGPNMKELTFADCGELTDTSMKIIGEHCSGLHVLNLINVTKLTDFGIRYLADGCESIQKLKLRRNTFSDEAIAAFLKVSGRSLTELSLNHVRKVSCSTSVALASYCSMKLLSLDLSWCRSLTDKALGLIVDNCSFLRLLKLFGCSQITKVFVDGHSILRCE